MATCLLTQSFALDCVDGIGGISRILIGNRENISAFTEANGVVTAITQVGATDLYEYEIEDEDAVFTSDEQKSKENATLFVESVVTFTLDKLAAAKSEELKLMASARKLVLFFKTNDEVWFVIGLQRSARKIGGTNQAASGKAFADKRGYTITISAMEDWYPYEVQAAVIAGLSIA